MARAARPLVAPAATTVLLVTLAVQVMAAMAAMTIPVVAPVMARHIGFPVEQTGHYMATMFAAAILSALSTGGLVARHGAIRVSQCALLSCALGLVCCTLPMAAGLPMGVVLIGLGYGPITPASSHLLALSAPTNRLSFMFSIKQSGVPLGGLLAGAIVPAVLLTGGWQMALVCVAATCVAVAMLASPLRDALDADRLASAPLGLATLTVPLRLVISQRPLLKLALVSLLFCAIQLSLTTYLVTYLHHGLGYTLVAAGLTLSIAQAGGAAGRVLWGHVADTLLAPRLVLALLASLIALGALTLALLPIGASHGMVNLLLALLGACAIGWNGVYLAQVARLAPAGQAGAATSGALVFTYTGMVVGPALFALVLSAQDGWRNAFATLVVPALACLLILLPTKRES